MDQESNREERSAMGCIIMSLCICLLVVTCPVSIFLVFKIVQEYERAVIFRLGRVLANPKGPGLFAVIPCTDKFVKIDLRTKSFDVPPQEVLTKDSVTVAVDAVVYFRISNPMVAVCNIEDADRSTKLLAQTTLRNMLGIKTLSEILQDRTSITLQMQEMLDVGTDPWGVVVERVEIKDVRLPQMMQRSMAAEAEATREAKAKVITAQGELEASKSLRQAADILGTSESAMQLRYLQTLNNIAAESNSTIIFPVPINMMKAFMPK